MMAVTVLGLRIPDAGPFFVAALAVHVACALICVIAGALAASARKRPGRHPRAGRVYLCMLAVVFGTASAMALIRWPEDARLFTIAVIAFGLSVVGWRARRSHRPGWVRVHAWAMGGSYIALLTGFYVDNGPQLPLWDRLPHWMYWVLPAAIGGPLIWWALSRYAAGLSSRPRAVAPSARRRLRLR
jgi:hypothetical protein